MNYAKALQKTIDEESTDADYRAMTHEQLEARIGAITKNLRGPLANHERILQVSIRRAMRDELARRGPAE